jgi:hypothetical protein
VTLGTSDLKLPRAAGEAGQVSEKSHESVSDSVNAAGKSRFKCRARRRRRPGRRGPGRAAGAAVPPSRQLDSLVTVT